MSEELTNKKNTFDKICRWMEPYPYVVTKINNPDKKTGIQMQALVETKGKGWRQPFRIEFRDEFPDSFIMHSTYEISVDYKKSVEGLREKEKQQISIDLRRSIYPLNIQLMPEYPKIHVSKFLFFEDLTKQIFFDSINHLMQSIQLIVMRYSEEYFKAFPNKQ